MKPYSPKPYSDRFRQSEVPRARLSSGTEKVRGCQACRSVFVKFLVKCDLDFDLKFGISDGKNLVKFWGRTFLPARKARKISGRISGQLSEQISEKISENGRREKTPTPKTRFSIWTLLRTPGRFTTRPLPMHFATKMSVVRPFRSLVRTKLALSKTGRFLVRLKSWGWGSFPPFQIGGAPSTVKLRDRNGQTRKDPAFQGSARLSFSKFRALASAVSRGSARYLC